MIYIDLTINDDDDIVDKESQDQVLMDEESETEGSSISNESESTVDSENDDSLFIHVF